MGEGDERFEQRLKWFSVLMEIHRNSEFLESRRFLATRLNAVGGQFS